MDTSIMHLLGVASEGYSFFTNNKNDGQVLNSAQPTYVHSLIPDTCSSNINPIPDLNSNSNPGGSKTIFFNPNFKTKIHINPHFKSNRTPDNNTNSYDTANMSSYQNSTSNAGHKIHVNPKILSLGLLELNNINKTKPTAEDKVVTPVVPVTTPPEQREKRDVRRSVYSRYKIVHSSKQPTPHVKLHTKINTSITDKQKVKTRTKLKKHNTSVTSRYKIDRRRSTAKIQNTTKIQNTPKIHNTTKIQSTTKPKLKHLWRSPKTPLKVFSTPKNIGKKKIVTNRFGQKFLINSNRKSLISLISNTRVTTPPKEKKRKLSFGSNVKLSINKRRKNNRPCPVYHRFGKCRKNELGRCDLVHNPDQIALCKKFLQGACDDTNCDLSHKIGPEKMPTCKYFLEGCCFRTNCSYLHVKLNDNADICRDFLDGYCKEGTMCSKRHQYLCPDFEKLGVCKKKMCIYPHKKKSEAVPKKVQNKIPKVSQKKKIEVEQKEESPQETLRYYEDKTPHDCSVTGIKDSTVDLDVHWKLSTLPSYIPFK